MATTTLDAKVRDFLAQKRIAVAGVSRDEGRHPVGNLIFARLRKSGHDVFPVNPHMDSFEGAPCYPDLASIPSLLFAVFIGSLPVVI
jgi:predicted CoA-binding protein